MVFYFILFFQFCFSQFVDELLQRLHLGRVHQIEFQLQHTQRDSADMATANCLSMSTNKQRVARGPGARLHLFARARLAGWPPSTHHKVDEMLEARVELRKEAAVAADGKQSSGAKRVSHWAANDNSRKDTAAAQCSEFFAQFVPLT